MADAQFAQKKRGYGSLNVWASPVWAIIYFNG